MELEKVESDLLALRQLYGLLENIGRGLQSESSENVSSLISKQSVFLWLPMSWSLDFQLYYFSTTLIILALGKINNKQLINFSFICFLILIFRPRHCGGNILYPFEESWIVPLCSLHDLIIVFIDTLKNRKCAKNIVLRKKINSRKTITWCCIHRDNYLVLHLMSFIISTTGEGFFFL